MLYILTAIHHIPVLHPCYKLEFFEKNHWDALLIKEARDMVQDEFDRTYWLLDIEGDDSICQGDGNITVSYSFPDTRTLMTLYSGVHIFQNQQHF